MSTEVITIPVLSKSDKSRLKQFIVKRGDCWEWIGSRRGGYGRFTVKGRTYDVHRILWVLKYGPIPYSLFVLHSCDNPSCCKPKHLFLGTQSENMQDCVAKGRHAQRNKLVCKNGHPYSGSNLYIWKNRRFCRTCIRANIRKYRMFAK